LDRRLGGPQSRSERGGEEKNSQPPSPPPRESSPWPSDITTELSGLFNLLGRNINTIKNNRGTILEAKKCAEQNQHIKIVKKSLENVTQFK
jgi:hypothetical protein